MKLRFEKVRLPLADFELMLDRDFDARVLAILGPSGAGKTSLLEIVAGLRRPRQGRVTLADDVLSDASARIWTPAHHRRIGYVPQDLALFPHLSVRENLSYGLRDESGKKLAAACEILEIAELLDRRPASLSGGQKQRVAFARAILAEPRLLLLDEPLASLDQALKERLFPYLQRIRDELAIPMLYVTHSETEARLLADQMITLERGRVVGAVDTV